MKKIIFVLGLMLYAGCVNASVIASGDDCAANDGSSTCHWEINSDGKLTITGSGAMKENFGNRDIAENTKADGTVTTAATWGDYWDKITSISIGEGITSTGARSFQGLSSVTSVTIPTSLETLGAFTFDRQPDLVNFTIPEGSKLTSMDRGAFQFSSSLDDDTTQKILETLSANSLAKGTELVLRDYTFWGAGLSSINIPEGVTVIESSAFYAQGGIIDENGKWVSNLTSITLPDTLTEIGDYAFHSHGLTELIIPDSVTTIGVYAFNGLAGTNVCDRKTYDCYSDTLKTIYIPDSVKEIGEGAFKSNRSLEEIVISDDVDTSGWSSDAFIYSPTGLTIRCQGDVAKCEKALEKYMSPACTNYGSLVCESGACPNPIQSGPCFKNATIEPVVDPAQCNGKYAWNESSGTCEHISEEQCNSVDRYYYNGETCTNRPAEGGIECEGSYYLSNDSQHCERPRLRYTMPEADAATSNDNENMIEFIFM